MVLRRARGFKLAPLVAGMLLSQVSRWQPLALIFENELTLGRLQVGLQANKRCVRH